MLFRKYTVNYRTFIRFVHYYSPQVVLTDESKKNCMRKFQTLLTNKSGSRENRTAGVLIPLCIHNNHVSILYTLRAANLTTHRGQVSFPGGMEDTKDESLVRTALRETYEELGILPEEIEIWGTGKLIITKNISILPVVGCLKKDLLINNLVLSPSEVEEVFTVPLQVLCNPALHGYTQFRNTYSTPVFFGGQHRIWGLTAVITHLFLKSLLPPAAYKHPVIYLPNVITNR